MVGQSGIASASAASAVTQRYRDAASIQAQRNSAKPREFASVLPAEPSVIATVSQNAMAPPPARLAPDAAVPAKPVNRSVLASPALAKRGTGAYGAAAALNSAEPDADAPSPSNGNMTIDC